MVGLMADDGGERIKSLIDCVTFAADNPSKLEFLHQLKHQLLAQLQQEDSSFSQYLPSLLSLHSDAFSPVRKCVSEVIGEIGLRHLEFLPEIIPELLTVVDDDTPAVARQAITSGTSIFCCTLEKIAIQGLCASKLDDSLESAWEWMLKLKEKIYSIAFESGCDGIRLLALKFVAAIILIYTPDPNGNTEPPPQLIGDNYANGNGKEVEFNISWLRKGHPILKLGDLSLEASRSLGLFLDQLRLPLVKSLSTSMVVVLINCLSAIAVKRPSFYGRILPVLLGLDPSNSVIKGLHAYGVQNALKNAYLSCLKCAHPSATPWRDRLLSALRELGAGELAEKALEGVCNTNGNVKEEKVVPAVKEEQSPELLESAHKVGRKRSSDLDIGNRNEDDDTPGKRARSMHSPSEGLNIKSDALHTGVEVKSGSSGQTMSKTDDLDAVQQLIGLFGALVAQGEKAAASIEILVSGICPDLLAEVVIANLRNLPPTRPMVEGDEIQENMGLHQKRVDPDTPFGQVSLFFTNALHSSDSGHMSSTMDTTSHNIKTSLLEESHVMDVVGSHDACVTSNKLNDLITTDIPSTSTSGSLLNMTKGSVVAYEFQDVGPTETAIPGLDDTRGDGPLDAVTSSLASADMDDGSQDQVTSVVERSKEELLPSLSTERSEELSSKIAGLDANIGMASTASSLGPVPQFVLPKMSAPVVVLSVEDKDVLQKLVFLRIVEAYKQVAVSGGSQLRFSLLSYLGNELSLDLDLWTCLQKHILSDYVNNEGHELTLRVLYRLYGEAEEERDFFSSRTATSVYETFLLKVAETLRDSFPASDKSLSRLFSEVPYLPESSLKLLECLCYPEVGDKDEKESHSGDRVTQGLSAVWSLIMLRPTLRDVLLKIALKSAAHHMEEVRMKAIRLVANKLYPLPSITLQIEEFAKEKLLFVVDTHSADTADIDKSSLQSQKNTDLLLATKDPTSGETMPMESCSRTTQSGMPGSVANTSVSEAQRWMSLYFALCTKKHGLLHQIFIVYKSSPDSVKQAIHCHMPILIRTVGASPSLIEILSDPPAGSEKLVVQVLHTLTDGRVPSNELISTIKKLYETKMKDIEILFPIFPFLPKEEVLSVFPQIVNLSQDKFQASLTRLLQGSTPSGPVLTPPEVLIAIHSIDPEKAGIPLKKVTDACNACFEQRQLFTQQVIAKVLNQLVEQIHPPLLFMRTVLQAIGAFPALVDFIMGILSRLVSKQIWKYPKLWVGFLKCAQLTQPHSFNVLLQLPQAQLEGALNKIPALKAPLAAHANQQNLKSTLPRSVLAVLGIASNSHAGSQTQSVQQTKIKEASGNTSDSQSGSQSQSAQLIKTNESSGVASDAQAEDAASSDKVVNDKSKESSGGS